MYRRRACLGRDVGLSTSVDEVKYKDTEVCSMRKKTSVNLRDTLKNSVILEKTDVGANGKLI